MWFLTFVVKNLSRRPLRSCLTMTAIAIAIGSFVTLVGISTGFEHSFTQIYEGAGIDIVVVRTGGRQRLNSALPETLAPKIKQVPGVVEVIGGLADMVSFGEDGAHSALVQGWEPGSAAFDHLRIVEGKTLAPDKPRGVLLGTILQKNINKKVGDTIELVEKEPFEVVGIYETANVFENGAMVVPLKELQRIMGREGMVTGFSLMMEKDKKDKASIDEARRRIEQLAPGLTAMSTRDHVKTLTEIRLAKGMAWMTSLIALLIGTFGMMNTMVMSIHERTREIGTLRAVGWRGPRVIRMILLEALLLSLIGALVGTIGALLLLRVLTRLPLVNGLIDGRLDPMLIVQGFLIAVAVGFVGGILPARRAARLLPIVALRHE
jgi:putative ABC transport system permease protein